MLSERMALILSEIPQCESFADVGCDHGIIAEQMLKTGKAAFVTISDVSESSLQKAEKRLYKYLECGKAFSVCCDGLSKVPECECVLIAGMGGEEIIKILSEAPFLPEKLVLQPMKNIQKVRRFVIDKGYSIKKDYIFKDKKYYDILVLEFGGVMTPYSETEFLFGRDNLKNRTPDFLSYVKKELASAKKYARSVVSLCDLADLNQRVTLLTEVLDGGN